MKHHCLGAFLTSVVNVLYHKASVTSLHHLLAALFGARYAGTPLTHCARRRVDRGATTAAS